MTNKKVLIVVSSILLAVNLIIGGLTVFKVYSYNNKIARAAVLGAESAPLFDKNVIVTNSTFSSTQAFPTEESVQNYLDQTNSPLKSYIENNKSAAYWIYNSARGNTSSKWGITPQLNPGLILAYLQKEQSLITSVGYDTKNDPEKKIRSAMGYGCPDTDVCSTTYYGFANQVNWAAYQLQYNYQLATSKNYTDVYQVGKTITTLDEYKVFLSNAGTSAQYRYTPHVYWGNYNLWKIITANGWGDSTTTYSMSDIDAKNLPLKGTNKATTISNTTIAYTSVENLLKKDYTLGTNSDDISKIQLFLKQEGYYTSEEITGMYGTKTQDALYSYRLDKSILVSLPDEACKVLISKTYVNGQTSEEIKQLQSCLRKIGIFNHPSDTGYFGPVTQKSLESAKVAIIKINTPVVKTKTECELLTEKTYTIGQTSEEIKKLQDCLTASGHFKYQYGSTGYFGEVTKTALNSYLNKLTTQPAIITNNKTECELLTEKTYTIGQTSEEIKKLQDCLTASGHFKYQYGSTGYFGEVTKTALNSYLGDKNTSNTCLTLKKKIYTFGQTNDEIKQLQDCMTTSGVYTWKYGSTGYFGEVTKQALIKWRGYF